MRHFLLGLVLGGLFLLVLPVSKPLASEFDADYRPDIISEPMCFEVINEAPYNIYGKFVTALYIATDGSRARHTSNFKLEAAGSFDSKTGYKTDRAEFCSYGPFFEGRKLEMTLRTLVPIFSCQTRIDSGPIIIHGEKKPEGGTKTWADCFE